MGNIEGNKKGERRRHLNMHDWIEVMEKNGHKEMQQPLKEGGTDPNTLAIWLNKISPGKSLVVVSKKLQAF